MTNTINLLWRRSVFELIIAGVLLTLAFAPFDILLFAPISFYLLLRNTYECSGRKAFLSGMVFGFSHFVTSLYWIGIALTVDINQFWWLIPFAVILIPAALSVFTGCATFLSTKVTTNKVLFSLIFSGIWTIIELIHGYFPLPFPWNFIGYIIVGSDRLLQLAPITGVHIASLLVVLVSTSFFTRNRAYIAICLLVITASFYFGYNVLEEQELDYIDGKVRIVQPNLAIHHMGDGKMQSKAFQTLVELSLANKNPEVKAVIWPEASFPYTFRGSRNELIPLSGLAPEGGYLIMGADRMTSEGKIYNSIVAISSDGELSRVYDKEILVPFGEYIPLRSVLPFISTIAYGIGDFDRGSNPPIDSEQEDMLSFDGLVCYEAIFPITDDLTHYKWLLNVTNDAWFGNSTGPYQHLAMARFKSAEYGISMVRVANTGVSAIISPYGIVIDSMPLNAQGVLDISIPNKLEGTKPISLLYQSIFILFFTFFSICISVYLKNRARR